MPQQRRSLSIGSFIMVPPLNTYLTFSTFLFISGSYYYYKILSSINFTQNVIIYNNSTITVGNAMPLTANSVMDKLFDVVWRHRLLFYILLNTCCAMIAFIGKQIINGLFNVISFQEENLLRSSFRRYFQMKCIFLLFTSHYNLFDEFLLWLPWLALHLVCMLTLDLSSLRMSNLFDLVSNRSVRRRLFAANMITLAISLVMLGFVFSVYNFIDVNYTLFMFSDCCLLIVRSAHLIFKLFTIVDVNAQRGHLIASSSYYVDLAYELIHDSIEFANYLHIIFFSPLAVTYCCVFLIVQAKQYYTHISTKIHKHWQHQEIVRHINVTYAKATDEDLPKDSVCTICWQTMKGARKLPCGHMFHELCLRRWLEQDSSCAICRQSLSLNLNNVPRRTEIFSEDVDNAMQYLFDSFSPRENRFSQWLRQMLLNERPLTDEQLESIVSRVAEMFPNYDRSVLETAARDAGTISGAVEILLDMDHATGEGGNQNNIENGFDSSDDEEGGLNTELETETDDLRSHAPADSASNNASTSEAPNTECKIMKVTFNSSNTWFVESARQLVEASRRKYLQSSRADDIRHFL